MWISPLLLQIACRKEVWPVLLCTTFFIRQASSYMKIKYGCLLTVSLTNFLFILLFWYHLEEKKWLLRYLLTPTQCNWKIHGCYLLYFLFILVIFSGTPTSRILLIWFLKREPMFPWFAKRTRKRGKFISLRSLW
jgi:hypothetical protein